MTETLC